MSGNSLIVIPARGGSKGIPRKNLRPVCGQPLIAYSIQASLASGKATRVVVTTEDDEIALFAERFGAEVILRPDSLASDLVPLDPVIAHAVKESEKRWGDSYDIVITVQPTSPLVRAEDIDEAISMLESDDVDTVISATDDRHLRWEMSDGRTVPAYTERVNRQLLPPTYRETGAIIGCKRSILQNETRIGENIQLHIMDRARSVDIDSPEDLWLCENILSRKRIVIVVVGSKSLGLGHAYRAIMIAHKLIRHEIVFVCSESGSLAYDYISGNNYRAEECPDQELLETILSLKPDMVINDILDTTADYILALKKAGAIVVNFEDLGLGAEVADLVINALYPHQLPQKHILIGPQYFCLRDEFLTAQKTKRIKEKPERALIMFGGVDEGDLTGRVLELVGPILEEADVHIDVILGLGYAHEDDLEALTCKIASSRVSIIKGTQRISDYMARADLAITSGGRTVFELASLGIPTITIAQNEREMTHTFASSENGIINLGSRHKVTDEEIAGMARKILDDYELRKSMRARLDKIDMKGGTKKVIDQILKLLDQKGATL